LVAPIEEEVSPDLLMAHCEHPSCKALAAQARAQGLRVEVDVLGRDREAFLAYARARGARRLLMCTAEEFLLVEGETERCLPRAALEEEMRQWTR
ncbi:MAG: hypothetical protein H5T66_08805, partial [Chloroflexi bacterium]|nr:hypothetical protein [Chloroflexota bacterium]